MRFAIYGAGMIGSRIAQEALNREHYVTMIVRHPEQVKIRNPDLLVHAGDARDAADVAAKVVGHDAVFVAISPRGEGGAEGYKAALDAVRAGCKQADVKRVLWVGGAGSLEVAPGQLLMDQPGFPAEYLGEAKLGLLALETFRTEKDLEWSVASPAAIIEPGSRRGVFKLGGDQLITDAKGVSRISAEDFAYACVYQVEKHSKIRQRFTAAYIE
jgi:putative NADH-flavin reductase